ncbi:hypothetical protein AXG93_4485s1060 [Marchantia polymorpha subsp. ruderalis]|uniref:Alpha-1,3-glucosyltransferase n=1 Tax=Marchantia polymorpha subsp. ruderalis TaxID=1480154 RepID=A0A176WFR1_MARPO|nr:hypothetical protein AXG93_4485s1060 [Marchantia polymorpha subsp. ruderalis]
MAITSSLPLEEWYLDETSEWTLDYPPFFAWFERFLALFASYVDPRMVDLVGGLNYSSETVILFHRVTVMAADSVLYWGLWRFCRKFPIEKQRIVYAAVAFSPGLLMVDHVHFQYNGFLLGILLLSLSCLREGRNVMGGFWFSVLVCFKHLFAVAGPIYFVYLLRHHCRGSSWFAKFFVLGSTVLSVVGVAFGPFIYYGQMGQVLKRLFPFGRGLCHAYWAPNFWSLYNTTDKVLAAALRLLGVDLPTPKAAMTGGLVGDSSGHVVLPKVTPAVTGLLVLVAMLPCMIRIWRKPRRSEVVQWIVYSYICGYMFGWHVHEKAALHFVVPLSLLIVDSVEASVDFVFISTGKEYPIKVLLLFLYTYGITIYQTHYFGDLQARQLNESGDGQTEPVEPTVSKSSFSASKVNWKVDYSFQEVELIGSWKKLYLCGLIPVELYSQFLHPFVFKDRLPFVPLMLISVYCAVGLFYSWAKQLRACFKESKSEVLSKVH